MSGVLYLVPTPIGNFEDITLRAVRVLGEVDVIACESFKETRRLLKALNIQKELLELNEHNEREGAETILALLKEEKNIALVSDCGTPAFSDPGLMLVQRCIEARICVVPMPGADSVLPALIASGFPIDQYYHRGWLSPKTGKRRQELRQLRAHREIIVLMETPYRLLRLLQDLSTAFPPEIPCVLAYELTTDNELFLRGTLAAVLRKAEERKLKGEFVLLLDNRKER